VSSIVWLNNSIDFAAFAPDLKDSGQTLAMFAAWASFLANARVSPSVSVPITRPSGPTMRAINNAT